MTIAGGNGKGDRLDQLSSPRGTCIDEVDQTIYIADYSNARIVEWTMNTTTGRIIAGGNDEGNGTNQLKCPIDVIIDRDNDSLIIAVHKNSRVM